MRLNKGITDSENLLSKLSKLSKFLTRRFRNQASGIWVCSHIDIFSKLFFYFFKFQKHWNIGTWKVNRLESLVYANNNRFFCSETVKSARTYINQYFFKHDF